MKQSTSMAPTPLDQFPSVNGTVDMYFEWWPHQLFEQWDALLVADRKTATLFLNPRISQASAARLAVTAVSRVRQLRRSGPDADGWHRRRRHWVLHLRAH
ncbi:hypothetical protein [Actinocatenispora rupis]|uniref:Uncharacterized protein n=1 Tax=Actinocatenispora rupis TaxID=519421 RepID=A0A8J3NFY4_9ACTN|nr:hypothetical protein [Actinocatenispora rupis]GID15380.1 hypothetical protein Aru02nite_62690 [Actinocatenispora rupis]